MTRITKDHDDKAKLIHALASKFPASTRISDHRIHVWNKRENGTGYDCAGTGAGGAGDGGESGGNALMPTYLYAIGHTNGPVKIGISDNPAGRLSQLQTSCPFPISLIHAEPCESREIAYSDERFIHRHLKDRRLHGEWFDVPAHLALQYVEDTVQTGAHFRWRAASGDL